MAPPSSLEGRQVFTWAAGIAAAAALGYVVLGDYLPSLPWSKSMEKDVVPGLDNRYGNDCFANCVIQGLAGIPSFREYLRKRVDEYPDGRLRLSEALVALLTLLNVPVNKGKTTSVESVISALENLYKLRISRNQQDSQEFLHLIFEALDREDTILKKAHADSETLKLAENPFTGELSTQITCQSCGFHSSWKKEAFTELSVAVPSKWSCSLLECLSSLITTDSIPDYACPRCTVENTLLSLELIPTKPAPLLKTTSRLRALLDQVKSHDKEVNLDLDEIPLPEGVEWKMLKTSAIRLTTVSKPPQVLAVHLVRSYYERGYGAGRNSCEVSFDEELGIPVYNEDGEKAKESAIEDDDSGEYTAQYRLMSLITHKGWHDSGHYMCYRRRKREKKRVRQPQQRSVPEESYEMQEVSQEMGTATVEKGNESEGVVAELGFEEIPRIELVDSKTRWWEISDEHVNGVQKTDVLSNRKGVYILFYERAS